MLLLACGQRAHQDPNGGILVAQATRQPCLSLGVTRTDSMIYFTVCWLLVSSLWAR